MRNLFVVPYEAEATYLEPALHSEDRLVVTGPGKLEAALGLTTVLWKVQNDGDRFETIVALSLGQSVSAEPGLHGVGHVMQLDFGVKKIEEATGQRYGDSIDIGRFDEATVVCSDWQPSEIQCKSLTKLPGAMVWDSETYAYATVALRLSLGFRAVKFVPTVEVTDVESWVKATNEAGPAFVGWLSDMGWSE